MSITNGICQKIPSIKGPVPTFFSNHDFIHAKHMPSKYSNSFLLINVHKFIFFIINFDICDVGILDLVSPNNTQILALRFCDQENRKMKFGKRLKQHVQETLPGWRDMYLNYKGLKKLVKLISSSLECEISEDDFVYLLDNEIEKFNSFFMEQEEDFIIRHKELQQRIKRVIENEPSPQGDLGEYGKEMARIKKDIVDFHGEMVLLVNYSNINYTGMTKILKKYDKRTGGFLRLSFIQKVLEQPFFTTELVSKLVKECETTIGDLFPAMVVAEEVTKAAVTVAGEGIFKNTVVALLTMKEIRKGSSTHSHFSLPALNLRDIELIRSFQFSSPITII